MRRRQRFRQHHDSALDYPSLTLTLEARVKERLTGAIIVVALLVLLVPELLTGPEVRQTAKPAGADGAQFRSYTIDLKDAANGQPPPPTAPAAAVSEQPVGEATPEAESASPPVAEVSPPVDDAARVQGKPMGSGADVSAAAPDAADAATGAAAKPAESGKSGESAKSVGTPSAEDDRPRSAFGPNARPQPESRANAAKAEGAKSAAAASTDASKAAAAKAEAQRAEAAKAEAARAAAAKADAAKAEATRLAAAKAESAKQVASRADASNGASPKAAGSKGWAVQLGVFGSRDNAERLAKQVKGDGFPVLVNESSGKDGKKLYWVRVGPERDQSAATALSTKLKAAGHRDARVVAYP